MEKKNKGFIVIIIILIILLLGLIGYIAYDKGLIFTKNIQKKEVNDKIKKDTKIEILSIIDAEKIIGNNKILLYEEHLYPENIFKIEDISINELILNGIDKNKVNYCVTNDNKLENGVTVSQLNNYLDNKILNHEKITIDNIKSNGKKGSLTAADYEYDNSGLSYGIKIKEDILYFIGSCDGEIGPDSTTVKESIIKAEKVNDKVYIYKNVAFGKLSEQSIDDNISYDYYKDYNRSGEIIETLSENDEISIEKYNTYKYTFKKDNDKYNLYSIELEK